MNNKIVPGSLSAMARAGRTSIAQSFMSAECIVIVDTSGSMDANDSRGGKSRYQVACDELAYLQGQMPGKIAVLSFSSEVMFCPNGVPFNYGAGTNLVKALQFAKVADVPGMRFILISDGEPSAPEECLKIARTYKNRIDVIYVGPEDRPSGRDFLTQLANACGGVSVTSDRAKELGATVQNLLLKA
jgi:Mg-chelatase subunit ChlD